MLYEVLARGTYFGRPFNNRWTYVSAGEPAAVLGSFGLAFAMGFILDGGVYPAASVFGRLRTISATEVLWNSVQVRAPKDYDVTDFYEVPYATPVAGLYASGDAQSPAAAWGFRTNRVRLDIDRGYKRFAGIPEAATQDGGVIASADLGYMANLADAMSDVLTYDDEGNTISYSPCVVSKQKYTTPSGRDAYRYYPTLALQLEHTAIGIEWQAYGTVRTQRSRQYR